MELFAQEPHMFEDFFNTEGRLSSWPCIILAGFTVLTETFDPLEQIPQDYMNIRVFSKFY